MSSVKKTINISPELFSFNKKSGVKKTKKKERKIKPKAFIKPNTLKKSLLKRIKDHQTNSEEKNKDTLENIEDFSNDFNKSLNYLQNLVKNKKDKKLKQKTLKNEQVTSSPIIELELPSELKSDNSTEVIHQSSSSSFKIENDVPYGCLKGGTKPTFREWRNKTAKNSEQLFNPQKISIYDGGLKKPIETERQNKLANVKNKYNIEKEQHKETTAIKQKSKKTTKRKYSVGKKGRTVGVLIKNHKTRKKIQREHGILKQKSIGEVKRHLYKKNLLKAGSNAPTDVVRTIYEQSVLAGDVKNSNKETTLHNFINN